MKRLLVLSALVLSLFMFASCTGSSAGSESSGQQGGSSSPFAPATYGDIFSSNIEDYSFSFTDSDKLFVLIYQIGDDYYRSYSRLTDEEALALSAAYEGGDAKAEVRDILNSSAVAKTDNLSKSLPDQAKLDSYKGKTGAELIDTEAVSLGYILQTNPLGISVNWGVFQYLVTFDKIVSSEDEIEDQEKFFRENSITGIQFLNYADSAYEVTLD